MSQIDLNCRCEGVCATHHTPYNPFHILERRDGLAEIVERGGGVLAERPRVIFPKLERESMSLSENASRHRHRSAEKRLGIFETL